MPKPGRPSKYTPEQIREAMLLYIELDSLDEVSKETGINKHTLVIWRKKYKWKEIKEARNEIEVYDPEKYDREFDELCKELNFTPSDREVYKNIRFIEDVCVASIKGEKQQIAEGVLPEDFKDAMSGLRTCWDMRNKILNRTTKDIKKEEEKSHTIYNIVESVEMHFEKERADTIEAITLPSRDLASRK